MVQKGIDPEIASEALDAYGHELSEQIRASELESPEGWTVRAEYKAAWHSGRDDSANLIDPYAK
jgi:hypothetical protein